VTQSTPVLPIDLDVASATDIESLPRIGPVLARRIVEDRDEHGPFGSLEGLERVRGVGPALARTLRERVTFSGTARPSNAVAEQRLRSLSPPSKPPRRRREK
jgi:competence protein ComEA